MATTQYIGARYVPKFFENSSGTAEWTANTQYEPLTIVTRNGNSYTSKKAVPASVGAPEDNAAYWVSTGIYNEQVQEYINEVRTFDGRITALENLSNRRYIVVSDSYGLVRGDVTPWTQLLQPVLGASNADYYIFAEGSMGFNRVGGDGHTVQSLLVANAATVSSPETITDVIMALGANDALAAAENGLTEAIKNCIAYVKATYTAARVHIGFIGNELNKNSVALARYIKAVNAYQSAAASSGASYIRGCEYIMHNLKNIQSDNVHPTIYGSVAIADYIAAYLNGGTYTYKVYSENSITSDYFGNAIIKTCLDGSVTSLMLNLGRSTGEIVVTGDTLIGEFENLPVWMEGGATAYFPVELWDNAANDFRMCGAYIWQKKLYFRCTKPNGITVPTNTSSYGFSVTVPTLTT